ncbi:MAG TPA: hypothetical protein VFS94_04510 [Gemmatimonadales bacterium]|nr:hypothetical protein [Gemmatimonadales bacterium]
MRARIRRPRLFSMTAALVLSAGLLAGCGESEPSAPDIEGKWVGTYGNGTSSTGQDFTLFFEGDGTLGVIDGLGDDSEALGTWELTGNVVTGTYTYIVGDATYSISGTISGNDDHLEGTWGNGEETSGSGLFVVGKE